MRARISASIAITLLALLSPLNQNAANAAVGYGVGIASSGLVGYWDARNPDSYAGTGSSISDLSGNGYTATSFNSPGYTHGSGGSYFSFVSTSSQYLSYPSMNTSYTNGFSFSVLADFGSTINTWERLIDTGNRDASDNILIGREGTSTNFWYEVYTGAASKATCKVTGGIAANTVTQWTVVISAAGACAIYKNGVSQAVVTGGGADARPSSGVSRALNYIGRSNWSGDDYFEGKIYGLAFYNRALTASEITQNYNSLSDLTWPTLSGGGNSVNENQYSATTISANQTSTFSIAGGADSGKFNIETATGVLTFKNPPNYELPDDSGTNRVYDVTVRALDLNGNYNDYSFTITILDVAEYASLTAPTLSGLPYKGIAVTITVTPSAGNTAGVITYLMAGKRIPGCYKKSYGGSGSSTCSWKPITTGYREISITFTPNGVEYAPATVKTLLLITKRSTSR